MLASTVVTPIRLYPLNCTLYFCTLYFCTLTRRQLSAPIAFAYIPGDCPASWMYSTTCVQYLYISCYLSDNKPVLLYLLLCLLPQYSSVHIAGQSHVPPYPSADGNSTHTMYFYFTGKASWSTQRHCVCQVLAKSSSLQGLHRTICAPPRERQILPVGLVALAEQ